MSLTYVVLSGRNAPSILERRQGTFQAERNRVRTFVPPQGPFRLQRFPQTVYRVLVQ